MEENTSKAYADVDPLANAMSGAGSGSALFVINLCASIAPVQIGGKNLPGLENYRLYQVARVEDGRTRHRLRLGFFTSESHAQSVLTVVRQQYPTAFTACLCDEDKKFARGYLPDSALAACTPTPSAATPKPPALEKAPVIKAPIAAAAPAKPIATAPPPKPAPTQAKAAPPTVAAAPVPSAKPAATAKVAKPAPAAEADIVEVTWEPDKPTASRAAPAPAPASARAPAPAATTKHAKDIVTDDDFVWEPPALNAAKALSGDATSTTARHPVLSAGVKTQQVIKSAAPAAKPPARIEPASVKDSAPSMRIKALDLTFSEPPAPSPQPAKAASNEPFHVGKGVQIGDLPISLHAETPAKAAAKPAPAPAAPPPKAPPIAKATPTPAPKQKPAPPAAKPAAAAPVAPVQPSHAPDLDTTQTIRALTSAELNDDAPEKFFAIQLAASEQPVNLDTMPHLDIFEAYRLYSVATAGSGKIVHSLRLGFFKEAVSAEAVCGYLKTFFAQPSVLRVSMAEHARFKDSVGPRRAESTDNAKSGATVVELNDARATRPAVPTVTMEVPNPRTDATGSFRMNATGTFRPQATGAFQVSDSGSHKTLTPALKPAAKTAGPATKRSEPMRKTGTTGKYKIKKSLSEQLIDEAREVELSESGIRKLPKSGSLLSKLLGK